MQLRLSKFDTGSVFPINALRKEDDSHRGARIMPIYIFNTFNDPSAVTGTTAFGVNDTDQIVGQYQDRFSTSVHSFLESGGTYTTLDDPLGLSTLAFGINASGQIVGQYGTSTSGHGFLFSGGTYTTLDVPSATSPRPWASTPRARSSGITKTTAASTASS
jgi:hypothetical protein